MKLNFDKTLYLKEEVNVYPIGMEVLLVTVADDAYLYYIDNIRRIKITNEGTIYYFEDTDMEVEEKNLIPYTIENEKKLKELDYEYSRNPYLFDDYIGVKK